MFFSVFKLENNFLIFFRFVSVIGGCLVRFFFCMKNILNSKNFFFSFCIPFFPIKESIVNFLGMLLGVFFLLVFFFLLLVYFYLFLRKILLSFYILNGGIRLRIKKFILQK